MNAYELFKKENQQRHRNDEDYQEGIGNSTEWNENQVNSDQEWSRELVQ